MNSSIEIKIIKETSKLVTVKLVAVNRKMPVPIAEFKKRLEQGVYKIVG